MLLKIHGFLQWNLECMQMSTYGISESSPLSPNLYPCPPEKKMKMMVLRCG